MILDRCKNCKNYEPYEIKSKSIFSSKPKTKYLHKGTCTAWPISMYRKEIKSNGWCEKYERKKRNGNQKTKV